MADTSKLRIIPAQVLQDSIGNQVLVRSKWGNSYVGLLVSVDQYMNVLLKDAQDQEPGKEKAVQVGDMLIRCNNVLYIRQVPSDTDLRKETDS